MVTQETDTIVIFPFIFDGLAHLVDLTVGINGFETLV